jgi:hypothetical protein
MIYLAVFGRDHDIPFMKRLSILICTLVLVAAHAASAQTLLPGASQFNPPPPAPPPPPRIEVPAIPQLDAPPRQTLQSVPQRSFSDRINDCLDEAAAAGVRPSRRAAYSRACANR